MNALELADKLQELDSKLHLIDLFKAATMLRQQQAEIEALKMGFANSGTSDSELAEVRAMANRQILKNKELQDEITGLKLEWQYMYDRANMDTLLPMLGLTDEEVKSLALEHLDYVSYDEGEYGTEIEIIGELDFYDAIIKAINRKASEK